MAAARRRRTGRGRGGGMFGGCFLMILAVAFGVVLWLIFPRLPAYEEVLAEGIAYPGEITAVEDASITVNGERPLQVRFRYGDGDGEEGDLMLAMNQSATVGQAITVRALDGRAYPEGLEPLRAPRYATLAPLALGGIGAVLFVFSLLRLVLVGGFLLARRV